MQILPFVAHQQTSVGFMMMIESLSWLCKGYCGSNLDFCIHNYVSISIQNARSLDIKFSVIYCYVGSQILFCKIIKHNLIPPTASHIRQQRLFTPSYRDEISIMGHNLTNITVRNSCEECEIIRINYRQFSEPLTMPVIMYVFNFRHTCSNIG